ncbi:hypothetical protein Tcan_13009 [Toxocara canis]|uniref:Uncharacterized protein n=2 Tax=Toxocara canis TaxID=6265 RepID=A0A0B2V265_TOXCA|nr:hypothetical protein Tcan_13009 [Toxocara canis]VDM50702.1 unnamed protein product [Toxocara canis]
MKDGAEKKAKAYQHATVFTPTVDAVANSSAGFSVLDTIPNSAMVYAYLVNSEVYHEMVFYAKTACMFNAANMVIVVMRTPTEIRERFLYYLHKWVPLKNHIVVVPARQRALCTRNFATLIPSD